MKEIYFDLAENVAIGSEVGPVYIAGPCVIENASMILALAAKLKEIANKHQVPLIFKASFDKANRSSLKSFRGPGLDQGLQILSQMKSEIGLPVLTDVHEVGQVEQVAEVVDVIQVPAFLCRQTDLLKACGCSGRPVNIKKGQFMAPDDMLNAVGKVRSEGNDRVTITERGSSFGYHNLVVDMRSFPIMRKFAPVVFDVTHSLQLPGGLGSSTDGVRQFHPHLARAAAAVGVDGFFAEVHLDPPNALCDSTTQLTISELDSLISQTKALAKTVQEMSQ